MELAQRAVGLELWNLVDEVHQLGVALLDPGAVGLLGQLVADQLQRVASWMIIPVRIT